MRDGLDCSAVAMATAAVPEGASLPWQEVHPLGASSALNGAGHVTVRIAARTAARTAVRTAVRSPARTGHMWLPLACCAC